MGWNDWSLGTQIGVIIGPAAAVVVLVVIIMIMRYRKRQKAELENVDALIYAAEVNKMNTVMDYVRRQRMQQILDGDDSSSSDDDLDRDHDRDRSPRRKKSKRNRERTKQQPPAPTLIMVNPGQGFKAPPTFADGHNNMGMVQSAPAISGSHYHCGHSDHCCQPDVACVPMQQQQQSYAPMQPDYGSDYGPDYGVMQQGYGAMQQPYVSIDTGDGVRTHAVEPLPEARIRLARNTAEYPAGPAPIAPPGYETVPIVIERARP